MEVKLWASEERNERKWSLWQVTGALSVAALSWSRQRSLIARPRRVSSPLYHKLWALENSFRWSAYPGSFASWMIWPPLSGFPPIVAIDGPSGLQSWMTVQLFLDEACGFIYHKHTRIPRLWAASMRLINA